MTQISQYHSKTVFKPSHFHNYRRHLSHHISKYADDQQQTNILKTKLQKPCFVGSKIKLQSRHHRIYSNSLHPLFNKQLNLQDNNIQKLKREYLDLQRDQFRSYRIKTDHQIQHKNIKLVQNDSLKDQDNISQKMIANKKLFIEHIKQRQQSIDKFRVCSSNSIMPKILKANRKIFNKNQSHTPKNFLTLNISDQNKGNEHDQLVNSLKNKNQSEKNNKKQVKLGLICGNMLRGRSIKKRQHYSFR